MRGKMRQGQIIKRQFMLVMLVMALAVRILIPAGWMPDATQAFAIKICTGVGMQSVWIDKKGALHKSDPAKHKNADEQPCAFAGMGMAADLATKYPAAILAQAAKEAISATQPAANIGHGLAAPPPPATGPPILI